MEYVELDEAGLVVVVGLVVVAGRVVTLEGVTTVRVTVPLGLDVAEAGLVVVVGVTVLDVVTVVVVVGFVVLGLLGVVGFVTVKSEVEAGVLEVLTLLVVGVEVVELMGWAVTSVGLFRPLVSVRAPVTVGVLGVIGVAGVELLLPELLKELPVPVAPPARLS